MQVASQAAAASHAAPQVPRGSVGAALEPPAPADAAAAFVRSVASLVDAEELRATRGMQAKTVHKFQELNAKLAELNAQNAAQYAASQPRLERYTRTLRELKTDLAYVFEKIRSIRARLAVKYPERFPAHEDEEGEAERPRPPAPALASATSDAGAEEASEAAAEAPSVVSAAASGGAGGGKEPAEPPPPAAAEDAAAEPGGGSGDAARDKRGKGRKKR
eukprot:tig00000939_g5483.t1